MNAKDENEMKSTVTGIFNRTKYQIRSLARNAIMSVRQSLIHLCLLISVICSVVQYAVINTVRVCRRQCACMLLTNCLNDLSIFQLRYAQRDIRTFVH